MSRYFIMSRAFAENVSPGASVPPAGVFKNVAGTTAKNPD